MLMWQILQFITEINLIFKTIFFSMRYHDIFLTSNVLIVIVVLFHVTKSEYFAAVVELEKLIDTEEEISRILGVYIKSEEARLDKLRKISQKYEDFLRLAEKDADSFLASPVNSFLLLKHLTEDWKDTVALVNSTESLDLINTIASKNVKFPTVDDFKGAASALLKLQHIYLLDTSKIAHGEIAGTTLSSELAATDCFELGKQAYDDKYSNYTIKWMLESLKRLEDEEIKTANKISILEYIVYSSFDVGNFDLGMKATEELSNIAPDHPRITSMLKYYQYKLEIFNGSQAPVIEEGPGDGKDYKFIKIGEKSYSEKELLDLYKRLCRGESMKTPLEKSKLYCHYTTNNNPYLLLQPVKVEIINFNPRVVLFHDIISDKESNAIKQRATPMLQRSVEQDTNTGKVEASTDRISKSTVLREGELGLLTKLNKRIADITGLSTDSSEDLHVINYGIGGHYDPHFDFAQAANNIELFRRTGNRIATWIYYLSDVPAGGSTVFPTSGIEMKPVKGAAGFWYNLFRNGKGDKRTLHAACPVLAGSKWVANKWLHEVGQEFKQPCSTNPLE